MRTPLIVTGNFNGLTGSNSNILSLNADGGAGKFILAGGGTVSGSTVIAGGTLQIGNNNNNGSLPPGGTVSNSGSLRFSRANNLTVANDIALQTISSSLTQAGAGILTLTVASVGFIGKLFAEAIEEITLPYWALKAEGIEPEQVDTF